MRTFTAPFTDFASAQELVSTCTRPLTLVACASLPKSLASMLPLTFCASSLVLLGMRTVKSTRARLCSLCECQLPPVSQPFREPESPG